MPDQVDKASCSKTAKQRNLKIHKFISSISDKNYADAHKYLNSAAEDVLIKRIDKATDKPLF
jgi:hypothetical protein